jgi:hypothetical protein
MTPALGLWLAAFGFGALVWALGEEIARRHPVRKKERNW